MKKFQEKQLILIKLEENPHLPLKAIAKQLGISEPTLTRRMTDYGIVHGRKRGTRKGWRKPIKEG